VVYIPVILLNQTYYFFKVIPSDPPFMCDIFGPPAVPQCVQGFLNEEALRIAVDVYGTDDTYNVRTHERQQRIIPGIRFTCTGMLTKWIIGAQRTLTQTTSHLQLQIWRRRPFTINQFDRTNYFSDLTDLNATDDLNVYEYVPNSPLQFQANDLLGLFQPHSTDTQVYYQVGGGPRNYASNEDSPLFSFTRSGWGVDRDVPLVAVEVSGKPYQLQNFTIY